MIVFLILVAIVILGISYTQWSKNRKSTTAVKKPETQSSYVPKLKSRQELYAGKDPVPSPVREDRSGTTYSTARFLEKCSYSGLELGASSKDYPQWMLYECGIVDPVKKHRQLIDDGYLIPADASTSLSKHYKVPELKGILDSQGITYPSKSKKDDLIRLLTEQGDLSSLNYPVIYVLSPKGEAFLKEQSELLQADKLRKYDISLEEYYAEKKQISFKPYPNDVAWSIFNRRDMAYTTGSDFGLRRNNFLHMAQLLSEEGDPAEALRYYVRVLFFDLCKNAGFEYPARVTPGIVKAVYDTKDHFQQIMEDDCFTILIPEPYLPPSKTMFDRYLKDILDGMEIAQLEEKYAK